MSSRSVGLPSRDLIVHRLAALLSATSVNIFCKHLPFIFEGIVFTFFLLVLPHSCSMLFVWFLNGNHVFLVPDLSDNKQLCKPRGTNQAKHKLHRWDSCVKCVSRRCAAQSVKPLTVLCVTDFSHLL